MSDNHRRIFVVDKESDTLSLITRVLNAVGYECHCFQSIHNLLESATGFIDCVITDLDEFNIAGSDLLKFFTGGGLESPVVVLAKDVDVSTAVRVMEEGAVTLIEKPFNEQQLMRAVRRAFDVVDGQLAQHREAHANRSRFNLLNEKEIEVMRQMVAGTSNKAMAIQLSMSTRTLDRRRRAVMDTMRVNSVAELAAKAERNRLFS